MNRSVIAGLLASAVIAAPAFAEKPINARPDRLAAVQGDSQFALDLYAKVRGQEGNLFFSPYSISTALAMTRAGARGETAAQMDKTLHFTLSQDKLNPAFAGLIKEINGDPADKKPGYQLSTANALWGQKGYPFKDDFLKIGKDDYGAGLNPVDFVAATEDARKTINAWVEKETHDKIKDLLTPGVLTTATRLVLTNAIYFKGDWASQFKKDRTKDEPFHLTADKKADAPLMHQTEDFGYLDGGNFQLLELPYAGKDLSMVVLLPKKIDGLSDLEKGLTAEKLVGWLGKVHKQKVIVSLPKFKTTQMMSMKEILSAMGMPAAFTPGVADLSGIAEVKEPLWISDVIHKAFIDVNEEGTEAAAATAVVVAADSAKEPPTPEFRADHPFVFLIRDKRSDSILFLGRMSDPAK